MRARFYEYVLNPLSHIPIETWDVSLVTDMSSIFYGKATFDADLSGWATSQVTTMFQQAAAFDNGGQPLTFDASSVTTNV